MSNTTLRTRWAAIGAAVAVTLGAGGLGIVSATSPAGATAYVPIVPCRAADTRSGPFNIGDRSTPLGASEIHVVTSADGDCTGFIPSTATGLQLNVTALNATTLTFLTVWPSGDRPTASSLNPAPGQPPTPNAVTTAITGAGAFNVFNRAGTVDVIVDVVGFYTDHNHDDRYFTKDEVAGALAAKADSASVLTEDETVALLVDKADADDVATGFMLPPTPVVSFGPVNEQHTVGTLALPAGSFMVNATLVANNDNNNPAFVNCLLMLGDARIAGTGVGTTTGIELGVNTGVGSRESIGLTGGGNLDAAGEATIECRSSVASGNWLDVSLTAVKVSSISVP